MIGTQGRWFVCWCPGVCGWQMAVACIPSPMRGATRVHGRMPCTVARGLRPLPRAPPIMVNMQVCGTVCVLVLCAANIVWGCIICGDSSNCFAFTKLHATCIVVQGMPSVQYPLISLGQHAHILRADALFHVLQGACAMAGVSVVFIMATTMRASGRVGSEMAWACSRSVRCIRMHVQSCIRCSAKPCLKGTQLAVCHSAQFTSKLLALWRIV